jgi:Fibronectin type III domain
MFSKNQSLTTRRTARGLEFALAIAMLSLPVFGSSRRPPPPPPPLPTPGDFRATATNESSVTLAWNASTGATGYDLYNDTTGLTFNLGNVTSYTWTGLQGGDTYSFHVQAYVGVYGTTVSALSPEVTVKLPAPPPPPPPVQPADPVITAVDPSYQTITVSWTESTPANEIGAFQILVNGAYGLTFAAGSNATSVTVGDIEGILLLAPATNYTLNVVAFSVGGTLSSTSAPVQVATLTPPNTTSPTAPTGLNGFGDGGGEAIISWNPSTSVNEPQTDIQYDIYLDGALDVFDSVVGYTDEVYIFPRGASVPAQVYVIAVDQYGNESPPSNILTIDSF